MSIKFKKGDFVEYIGVYSPDLIGHKGVVSEHTTATNVRVYFAREVDVNIQVLDETHKNNKEYFIKRGVFPENIRLIQRNTLLPDDLFKM